MVESEIKNFAEEFRSELSEVGLIYDILEMHAFYMGAFVATCSDKAKTQSAFDDIHSRGYLIQRSKDAFARLHAFPTRIRYILDSFDNPIKSAKDTSQTGEQS